MPHLVIIKRFTKSCSVFLKNQGVLCTKSTKWRDNLKGSIPTKRPITMILLVIRTNPRRRDLPQLSNKVQSLQVVNKFLTLAFLLLLVVIQLNVLNA